MNEDADSPEVETKGKRRKWRDFPVEGKEMDDKSMI